MPKLFDQDKNAEQKKSEMSNPLARWLGLGRDRHNENAVPEAKPSKWLPAGKEAAFQNKGVIGIDGYKLAGRDHFRASSADVTQEKVWFNESRIVMTAIPAVKEAKDAAHGHVPQDSMRAFALGGSKKIYGILDGVSLSPKFERLPNSGKMASGFLEYVFKNIKSRTLAEFMNQDVAAGGFGSEVENDPANFDQADVAGQIIRDVRNTDGSHTLEVLTLGRFDQFGMMVIIHPNGEIRRLLPDSHMIHPSLLKERYRSKIQVETFTSEPFPAGSILVMCSDGLYDGNEGTDFSKRNIFWDEFRAKCMGGKPKLSSDELANLLKNFSRNADDLSLMTVEMFAEQER